MSADRSVVRQLLLAGIVIAAGLSIRHFHTGLPRFWTKYLGDALWALLVYLLFGAALRRKSSLLVGGCALIYSCATEFSQLYRAPWIDALRRTTLGRLVLGDTFAWADMLAYAAGVCVGLAAEETVRAILARKRRLAADTTGRATGAH